MLNKLTIEDLSGGINMIDLGSNGEEDSYRLSLLRMIDLYAFDPNREENIAFENKTVSFQSVRFLPCAIAGKSGSDTLYKTQNPYCWSLLEPDMEWMSLFRYMNWIPERWSEKLGNLLLEISQIQHPVRA